MITVNGSPKTGTHLLLKAVYTFEGEGYTARHTHSDSTRVVAGKHIHIKRNPRNVLISYIRYLGRADLSKPHILKTIPIVIEEMKMYLPLLTTKAILNVSFEELLTNPAELGRIAAYIGLPCKPTQFDNLWGNTLTFTGSLSNWRDYWDDDIAAEWEARGGKILEALMGYAPDTDPIKIRKAHEHSICNDSH